MTHHLHQACATSPSNLVYGGSLYLAEIPQGLEKVIQYVVFAALLQIILEPGLGKGRMTSEHWGPWNSWTSIKYSVAFKSMAKKITHPGILESTSWQVRFDPPKQVCCWKVNHSVWNPSPGKWNLISVAKIKIPNWAYLSFGDTVSSVLSHQGPLEAWSTALGSISQGPHACRVQRWGSTGRVICSSMRMRTWDPANAAPVWLAAGWRFVPTDATWISTHS